ncbi:uncharacterized protein LOC108482459 isoform X2 [Gossypium arboreum]|uniref:RNase H type-1 domain-containing protein n=2 Tax=Gossypium arboreum TaxID=29729 RepID=A0ABR0R163_GOSAR|nr:uncharacterized protein LOC108482459 isoform X2 [Gossypium arboreum]KAK5845291.1 hypothetical protein PVK06_001461 [Gossypium arboreum]
MWAITMPTKLAAFAWRLCQFILHHLFSNGPHWLEFVSPRISNEDYERLLTILWALWSAKNGNLIPEKDRNEKEDPDLDQAMMSKPTVFSTKNRWIPPPMGLHKVNFDGAFDGDGKKGGIGVIIRDNEGFVWGGAAIKIDDVMEGNINEAWAAVKALKVAQEMGYRRIILESDCFWVLNILLMEDVEDGSYVRCIVEEGKRVMGELEECYFHHIEREGNQVANLIARHSVIMSEDDFFWKHDYPNFIHQSIMCDAINL